MKKFFLSLFLLPLIAPIAIEAQESQPLLPKPLQQHHEIGINLFSMNSGVDRYFDRWQSEPAYNFIPGLYYNYHFGKNALRATLNYNQKVKYYISNGPNEDYADQRGITRVGELRLGYQREFGNGKLRPYVYGDLLFRYTEMDGWGTYCGCFGCYEGPISGTTIAAGAVFGGGVRYQAGKHFALSAEAGVISTNEWVLDGIGYDTFDVSVSPVSKLGLSFTF